MLRSFDSITQITFRLNFWRQCYFKTLITPKGSSDSEMYKCTDLETVNATIFTRIFRMGGLISDKLRGGRVRVRVREWNLFCVPVVAWASQRTSLDFIVLYWTLLWLDLKMIDRIYCFISAIWLVVIVRVAPVSVNALQSSCSLYSRQENIVLSRILELPQKWSGHCFCF